MNEEYLKKLLEKRNDCDYDYDGYDIGNYDINSNYEKLILKNKKIDINDVLKQFTPEQLIDAIGEANVEKILRMRKLKKIAK